VESRPTLLTDTYRARHPTPALIASDNRIDLLLAHSASNRGRSPVHPKVLSPVLVGDPAGPRSLGSAPESPFPGGTSASALVSCRTP